MGFMDYIDKKLAKKEEISFIPIIKKEIIPIKKNVCEEIKIAKKQELSEKFIARDILEGIGEEITPYISPMCMSTGGVSEDTKKASMILMED